MIQKVLEVENLKITFHTDEQIVRAVAGIHFVLNRGETLGIVGESGSGKSVTALSLMRLLEAPPAKVEGKIVFHPRDSTSVDLLDMPANAFQQFRGNKLAMIFQEPMTSLNPVFTCGAQVEEVFRLHQKLDHPAARLATLDMFAKVKLPDPERIAAAYPHQISGGQKQRVMIAMAMACRPDVLIADEPTTALDVSVQQTILQLMQELQQEWGTAIIFITHDLGVVAEIADRVLVMHQGEIVEEGTLANIFQQPKHPYTQGLLACRPSLDYRLKRLPLVSDFLQKEGIDFAKAIEQWKIKPQETTERVENLQKLPPLIQVKDLKTWFPAKKNFWGKTLSYIKAVDGVTFDVYPGETLGLVGESGCGKTTLGRSILHLIRPTEGSVLIENKNIETRTPADLRRFRRDMQIIFQDPYSSLNPRITIGSAIMEPMRVHGLGAHEQARREYAIELLQTVGLEAKHFHRYPHEFSGGQRQRICIARALSLMPKFIVCDEAVSALDVSVQAQVLNLLMELREKHQLTYIFISHDLSVVKLMSDRMMVMHAGKVEELGAADAIYNNPQSEHTQRLIAAIPKGGRVYL